MNTFTIKCSYKGYPSKDYTDASGLSLQDAKARLSYSSKVWIRNGGEVLETTDTSITLCGGDGELTHTLYITEQ